MARSRSATAFSAGANLGFEAKLWQAADALCNNTDADEHKHVLIVMLAPYERSEYGSSDTRGLAEQGLTIGGMDDAGTLLDSQAVNEYRGELRRLQEEMDMARELGDEERAVDVEEAMQRIAQELTGATGLRGRARKAPSPAERARINVTKQIKKSLGRINAEYPALGQFLSNSIKTGAFCSYRPDRTVDWAF